MVIFDTMEAESNTLVIDAGNTSIKVAEFKDANLVKVNRFSLIEMQNEFGNDCQKKTIISSVLSDKETDIISQLFPKSILVTSESKFPFSLSYETKGTLGIDRICNAAYASANMSTEYAVVIDIGTCVKFDVIHKEKGYLGGSISPGINLRYKSLNDYTGKLPLLSDKSELPLIGVDTETSMRSGVLNGLKGELLQFMEEYKSQFSDLTFFVTGGDARYFDLDSKNDIFADRNLTLKGLYEIYKFNA